MWGTVSLPEVIWTAIGIVGLWIKLINIKLSERNFTALKALNGKNLALYDDMFILATAKFRRDLLRVVMSIIIIGVGGIAMALPQTASHISSTAVAVTFGFFFIEIIDVVQAALDNRLSATLLQERKNETR